MNNEIVLLKVTAANEHMSHFANRTLIVQSYINRTMILNIMKTIVH